MTVLQDSGKLYFPIKLFAVSAVINNSSFLNKCHNFDISYSLTPVLVIACILFCPSYDLRPDSRLERSVCRSLLHDLYLRLPHVVSLMPDAQWMTIDSGTKQNSSSQVTQLFL